MSLIRIVNRFDLELLSNIGIGFKTSDEMNDFVTIVNQDYLNRIANELSVAINEAQLKEFFTFFVEDDSCENKIDINDWMIENCSGKRIAVKNIEFIVKNELIKCRPYIPGLYQLPIIHWNGQTLWSLKELRNREVSSFQGHRIETLGELYTLSEKEIAEILGYRKDDLTRSIYIKDMVKKSREEVL